ncbi:non-SMC mitotic condensation complex subunit 1-domain-containing protein [Cubamyces lactineus]|nr:non-SMC mitotic condensation complex subunit 1-domain-containing protein [Cubamyces lactineus]
MDNFELQEELQAIQDVDHYSFDNESDLSSADARDINHLLESAVDALAHSSDNITDPAVFDAYRSLLKHAAALQGSHMIKILDSISSAYHSQLESTVRDIDEEEQQTFMVHKAPLEMYAFLLNWFVSAAEKVKTSGEDDAPALAPKARRGRGGKAAASRAAARKPSEEWSWQDQIPPTLNLVSKVLRMKTQRIWQTSAERETFINCVVRPVYHITENEQYMKSADIRRGVYKAICLAVKHQGHALAAQISIMQSLQYYEHLSEPMAECLNILAREFDHAQLGDEILREIAGKTFSAQDTKGPRAFSRFLVRYAELAPRQVLKQLSLLLAHLDSESYPMRMALVEVIGAIIRELAESPENDGLDGPGPGVDKAKQLKQINGLYDLLLERTLDLSSYVRVKVLSTLAKLCDGTAKFPQQRLAMTRAAVDALEDKASGVRKAAVSLLVRLILTHPYGVYGGFLSETEWKERYEQESAILAKMEGEVGKAVEREDGEDGSQAGDEDEEDEGVGEDEDEDMDGEDGGRKKRKKKRRNDDEMEVDDEGEEEDVGEDEDARMSDGSSAPKPRRGKTKTKKKRKSELDLAALTNEAAALGALNENQHLEAKLKKKFCLDALEFIRTVEEGMKTVQKLLASTNKLEVLEAMEFFRVTYEYKFDAAEAGIKKMLHLIWSKDNNATSEDGRELKSVRSRLLECYRTMYFEPVMNLEPKAQVNRIAKNMIEMTYNATLAELTSLEEMMRQLMEEGHIHEDVVNKLWQVYSSERPLPRMQRRGAVIILGMLALAKRSVVADRVETLVKVGLGDRGKTDLTLARYTCVALQRLNGSVKKVKGSLLDKTLRIDMDNPLFRKLQDAIERPCRTKEWFPMAEQAINTVYALGERPDILCGNLIKNLTKRVFGKKPTVSPSQSETQIDKEKDPDAMDEDDEREKVDSDASQQPPASPTKPSQGGGIKDAGDAFELSQLLFVVGHVAIKQIVFLELVEREWKRQKHEKELAAKIGGASTADKSKEQEELDQVAGNAEDEIGERIAAMREQELLYGSQSLLATFGPMLVHICGSPHKFKNRTLRMAATLAFSKFLCVSSAFCEQNHRLLFKILETSKDPSIRSNIVIALGDVAVSFSSIIDESNDELYKGLRDPDMVVKKNTLMVLTHLILNGMVKVKGQMGEMAKCVEDEDERISDLAKLFFAELSTKDNAIYNNLPDVISHLSVGAHAIDEEAFQSTMKYIFTFIEKEKQAENIVEKLCQRFRLSEDPRQWRDIAFCLSLLPFKSERSVKKLMEGLQYYRDKLHEEAVYARFQEILTKARSNKSANKPDAELNEFEAMLEENRRQGAEDQDFEKSVQGRKAIAKKRATRRTATRKKPAARHDGGESD